MNREIVQFLHKCHLKYKTDALYFPDDDIYSIRFHGRAVQNFTSTIFYQIPKQQRFNMIRDIIHLGLNHNEGEKHLTNQRFLQQNFGKKIK
jgi:hypothetical protein